MIQIRGIVKIAQRAQESLKDGILASDATAFKQFVADSVETIERLCCEAKIQPNQLPARSRNAYYFLKRIDLDNLPLTESDTTPELPPVIRLKNIKTQQRNLLQKMAHIAANPNPNSEPIQELSATLAKAVAEIEKVCLQQQATPAKLTSSARSIYAWMKFLTNPHYLKLHLQATCRIRQMALDIWQTRYPESDNVIVDINNIAGVYKSRRIENAATLVISEGFINASDDILFAVASDALLGKTQATTKIVREFASSEEYSEVLLELDLITEAIAENAKGKFYNLDELFDKVNREYFAADLAKPRLAWSQIQTYRKFGHYEPARDRVVISLTLDDARIPPFVVEFVLYHELLHKYHGITWMNGRRMVHTPEFRQNEREFRLYQRAEEWLNKVVRSPES